MDIFASISQLMEHGPTADEVAALATTSPASISASGDDTGAVLAATSRVAPRIPQPLPRSRAPEAASADAAHSESFLADEDIARYERDINESGITAANFAPMLATTFGLSGSLSGVSFNESALIPFIQENIRFPCIRAVCNFGKVEIPEFEELVRAKRINLAPIAKSSRARAKKQKRAGARPRKIQGNGTCFNSSILFWIYSEIHSTVYKIRLFRTGQFGLPGTKPEMIRDILNMVRSVFIPTLAAILRARDGAVASGNGSQSSSSDGIPSGQGPAGQRSSSSSSIPQPIALTSLTSIMKNYKWRRLMPRGSILNLAAIADRVRSDARVLGQTPFAVSYVQYGICDAKLSVKFITPRPGRTNKTARINVFLSGKINILGAYDSAITKNICAYLVSILTDDVVVSRHCGDHSDSSAEEDSDPDAFYSDD